MKIKNAEPKPEPPFFDTRGAFHFRPISSDEHLAFRLEFSAEELAHWFERFEIGCVLGCCGIHALGFKPSTEWDLWPYNPRIMRLLGALEARATSAPSDVLSVPSFQVTLYKEDFLVLLRYLQDEMRKSIQWN